MFLTSGSNYYSYPLLNITIVTKNNTLLSDVTLKFKLLSYSDLYKLDLIKSSGISEEDMYEEICNKCVIGILHYEKEEIDFNNSPAGVVSHLGRKILYHSRKLLEDVQQSFEQLLQSVTLIDQLAVVVSRYTSTPIKEVREYPLDFLIKEYGTIHLCFPDEVRPIVIEEETDSVVGG